MRDFEDLALDEVKEAGPKRVLREEIIAFARQFDPQPFHLDDAAGKATHFGGLVASGWHTAAMGHRLLVDHILQDTASMGSPGVDELRWMKPVRPDDLLTLRATLLEKTPSRSKPDRGSTRWLLELRNQHGQVVMACKALALFARRPA